MERFGLLYYVTYVFMLSFLVHKYGKILIPSKKFFHFVSLLVYLNGR